MKKDDRLYRDSVGQLGLTVMAVTTSGLVVAAVAFNDESPWILLLVPALGSWAWLVRRRLFIKVTDEYVEVTRILRRPQRIPLADIAAVEEEWSWASLRSIPGMRLVPVDFVPFTPAFRMVSQRGFQLQAAADIAERLASGGR